MSDLYATLGLTRSATPADIKKAYRAKALEHHPDKGGDTVKFQKVQEANAVLSDPEKRALYDATGQVSPDSQGGGPDIASMFGFGGLGQMFGGFNGFNGFGGGGSGGTGKSKAARGPNKMHEIGVSLHDLYVGKTFTLNMKRDVLCAGCNGNGGSKMEACAACAGRGTCVRRVQMGPMTAMTQEPCRACEQTGKKAADTCATCKGRRVQERASVLDGIIEPGMQEGDAIVFQGQCSESPMYAAPGDVVLIIRAATTESNEWERKGRDLMMEVRITLAEALLGWERTLTTHPSGKTFTVGWKSGVLKEGDVLRVPGWGMPVRGETGVFGDLHLVCRYVDGSGEVLTEEQRQMLRQVWPAWKEPSTTEAVEAIR